jgi:class 3 adenylate cyclase
MLMNKDTELSAKSSSGLLDHPFTQPSPQHTPSSTATDVATSSATNEAEIAKQVQQLWPRMTPFVPIAVRDCILASMKGEKPCNLGPMNPTSATTSLQSKDDDNDDDEKKRKLMPSLSMISNLHRPTAQPIGGAGGKGGGVVLIADVSGFTSVTEEATIQGVGGVELLARSLNCYFEPIIDLLQLFSGDIIKFAGDSLVVVFTPTEEEKKEDQGHGGLQMTVLRALQCGWRLANEFGSSKMQPDGTVVPIRRTLVDDIGDSGGHYSKNKTGLESSLGGDANPPTSGRSSSPHNNNHDQQEQTTPMSPKSPFSAMFPMFFDNMMKHHQENNTGTTSTTGTAGAGSTKGAHTSSLSKSKSSSTNTSMAQRKKLVEKKMMNELSDFALQWNLNAPDLRQPSNLTTTSGFVSARTRTQQPGTAPSSASQQKKTTTTTRPLPEDMRQIKSDSYLEQTRHEHHHEHHHHHRHATTSSLSMITAPIEGAHDTATIIDNNNFPDSRNASAMQSFTSNQSGFEYGGGGRVTTATTTTTVATIKAEDDDEEEESVSVVQSSFTSNAPPQPSVLVDNASNNKKTATTIANKRSFVSRLTSSLKLTKRKKKTNEQHQHQDSITTTGSIRQQVHVDHNGDGLAPLLSLSESMVLPDSTSLCRQTSASISVAQLSPSTGSLVAGSVLEGRQTLGSGTESMNNDNNASAASLHTKHSRHRCHHQNHRHQRSQSGNQSIDPDASGYLHYQQQPHGQQKGRLSLKVMIAVGKLWAFHVGGQGDTYTAPREGTEEEHHEEEEERRGQGIKQPLTKGTASNTAPLQVDPRWEYFIGDLPHALPPTETSSLSPVPSPESQEPSKQHGSGAKEGSVKKGLLMWDSPPKMKRGSGGFSEMKVHLPPATAAAAAAAAFSLTPSLSNERPTMVQLKMIEKYATSGKVVMSQEVVNLLNDQTTSSAAGSRGALPPIARYLEIIKEEKDHGDDDKATPLAAQLLASPITISKTSDSTLLVARDENTSVRRPADKKAQTRLQMELDILSSQPAATQWAAIQALRLHIPDPATSRIMAGQISALNEFRVVTCVFLGFPSFNQTRIEAPLVGTTTSDVIKMTNVQESSSFSTINKDTSDCGCIQGCSIPLKLAADVIQKAMGIYGGSLLQMRCDEKGHLAVCAFGLAGHLAEDFVFKGMQAALFIVKEMERYGEKCCAGVTTGNLFCGAVGSEKRYEYTVLGDAINLSARLMVKASQMKPPISSSSAAAAATAAVAVVAGTAEGNTNDKSNTSKEGYVFCDEATKRLFEDAVHINAPAICEFLPLDPLPIKGKRFKVAAFLVKPVLSSLYLTNGGASSALLPWDPTINDRLAMRQQQQTGGSDGMHQNKSGHHPHHQKEQPMYGRQKELDMIESSIVDLVLHNKGATVLITGLPGIGKTRMIEALQVSSFGGVREQCIVVMGVGYAEKKSAMWYPWKRVFSQLLAKERMASTDGGEESLVDRLAQTVPNFEQLKEALKEALGLTITSTVKKSATLRNTTTITSNNRGRTPSSPPPSSSSEEHHLFVDTTITLLLVVLQQFAILRGPLVMLLEDLHYFDSASWKLLAAVGEQLVSQGLVLVVGTYRTQFANLADITFPRYTPLPTTTKSPLSDTPTTPTSPIASPHIIHDVVSHCFYRLASVPSIIDMELQPLSREDSIAIMTSIVGIRLPQSVGELVWYRGGGYPGFIYQMGVFLAGYIQKQVDRSVEILEMKDKGVGSTKGGHRLHKHNNEEEEEEDEYSLLDAGGGGGAFSANQSNKRLGARQLEALDTKFAPNVVPGARLISAAVEHIRASVKTHKVITARVDELSPEQAACIKAASALGHIIDTDMLLALLKRAHMGGHSTKGEVEEDLEMLVRGGLLKYQYDEDEEEEMVGREESTTTTTTAGTANTTGSSGYYCFRQQVIRGIVYDSISPDIRRNLHSVLVDILQKSGNWEDSPEVLAYHYRMSVQWGVEGIYPDKTMMAINYSEKAAMKCIRSGAGAAEAAEHLQRAQVLAGRLANAHVHSMGGESFWKPASLHALTIPRARRACWEQLTAALCLASETSVESLTQAQMHCLYALSFLNLPQPGQLLKEKRVFWVFTWLDYTLSTLSCFGAGTGGEVGSPNGLNVPSSEQQQYRSQQCTRQGMDSFSSMTVAAAAHRHFGSSSNSTDKLTSQVRRSPLIILDQQGTTIPLHWLQFCDDSSLLVDTVAPNPSFSSSSHPSTPGNNNSGSASQRILEENTGQAELSGTELREAKVVLEILVTTIILGGNGSMDKGGLKYVMIMCMMLEKERRGGGGGGGRTRRMSAESPFYNAWKQAGNALRYGIKGKRGKLWCGMRKMKVDLE